MKTIIKISILALLLCIGFIPTSTAGSFEPAKTALYLGENNPGNYSLLQYAIEHGSSQGKSAVFYNPHYTTGSLVSDVYVLSYNHEPPVIQRMMSIGHKYQVPFHLIGLFFSN